MVTITPSERFTPYSPVVPTSAFPVGFPIFDNADVTLTHNGSVYSQFTVSGTYIDGVSTDAMIHTDLGLVGEITIIGNRSPRREDQYGVGKPLPVNDHNYSLNRLTVESQEHYREAKRGLKLPLGVTIDDLPLPERGKALVGSPNGTGYVNIKVGELSAGNSSNLLSVDAEGNISSSETPINEKTLRENGDLAVASLIAQAGYIEVPYFDTRLAVSFAFVKATIGSIRTGGYDTPGDGGEAT